MPIISDFKSGLRLERLRELLHYDPNTGIFRWRLRRKGQAVAGSIAGCLDSDGYRQIGLDGRRFRAARLAWFYVHGVWPPEDIDHKDLIKDHDWIENLRPASRSLNTANKKIYRNNISGFKGVFRRQGRWQASIFNKKPYYLGMFDTPEEAHQAYCAKARELFGEFANDG